MIGPTCGIGELILLPLDLVLQRLSLAPRLLDASLHGLRRDLARPAVRVHLRVNQLDTVGVELMQA